MKSLQIILTTLMVLTTSLAFAQVSYDPLDFVGPPLPDHIQSPKETKLLKDLLFSLSGYEKVPTREELDAIGTSQEIEPLLIKIVSRPSKAMHRLRAIDVLGFYHSPQTLEFLNTLAHAPNLPSTPTRMLNALQHRAIVSLARSARQSSAPKLQDLLHHQDLQIQLTTVAALGKHAGSEGRKLIQQLVNSRPDRLIIQEAEKFLQ